ncbi:MAG: propionyl-coenzyme A carboxylase alpha polypeptide [Mesorhizobium sp.]|nr:MAG: propionyl-coenzyme A carboxylase alpha polypeptide [Mesorhizobium sp.]
MRSFTLPSGLPAISPTSGEISWIAACRQSSAPRMVGMRAKLLISPLRGEMAGRPEGGAA